MKEYRVTVQASAETVIYVNAQDSESAWEMAADEALSVDREQWSIYNPMSVDCEDLS